MSLVTIGMKPGVNLDITRRQNEGGWSDANLVRFRQGLPEAIGGWAKTAQGRVIGTPRRMWTWTSISGQQYVAIGTHTKLYIYYQGQFYDITPIRLDTALGSNPVSVTSGSATVTVTATAHGAAAGDYVTLTGSIAVGGISATLIDGEHQITSVTTDTFTFTASSAATSTATGGGADMEAEFQISIGRENAGFAGGWGSGGWGRGGWLFKGVDTQSVTLANRTWSLDNWGEYLIASPHRGGIFKWEPQLGLTSRATVINNAPTQNLVVIVSGDDRHLMSFGNNIGGDFDPLFVAWCSQGDLTDWTPGSTDTSGDYRASLGNEWVAAIRAPGEILAWTDNTLYGVEFTGPPFVFSFRQKGASCGAVSPMSPVVADGQVFWKGRGEFFTYNGVVNTLPCPVMRKAFDEVNLTQEYKMHTAANTRHNEIMFFHASEFATEVDSYVSYNYVDGIWSCGKLARTCWADQDTFRNPLACSPDGYLYTHEFGLTADGQLLGDWIESGDIDIGEGDQVSFIDKVIPDFIISGRLGLTFRSKAYPGRNYFSKGPYDVTPSLAPLRFRLRGRSIAFRIESLDVGTKWRYGAMRANVEPDGDRD